MEIPLANNSALPKPVAVGGQAAALVPKPPGISSEHSPEEMLEVSAQAGEQPLLSVLKSQHLSGTTVLPCLCWHSLAVPGEPGQHRSCPQPSPMAGREAPICILSEVKGEFHQC